MNIYKQLLTVITVGILITGCTSTNNNSLYRPTIPHIGHVERTNVKASKDKIYAAAKRVLELNNEHIEVDNPEGIFISTTPRKIQFTTDLFDCLPNQNIDDSRVQTEISYMIMILDNQLGVRVPLKVYSQPENSSEKTELLCFSNTILEKEMTKKILAEIK